MKITCLSRGPKACCAALAVGCLFLQTLPALDWPRFRGPDGNGISRETGWLGNWPAEGPRQVWKASVGIGFASFSVANGRAYTTGNKDNQDTIHCFDANTGALLWRHTYAEELDPRYYEGGTSATPTVDGGAVFCLSRKGILLSLDAAKGTVNWQVNAAAVTDAPIPQWGFASSPLLLGDLVLVNVGAAGAAFDRKTGKAVWSSGKQPSGYTSLVPVTYGGVPHVVFAGENTVMAVATTNGRLRWSHPWKTQYEVNAADPVIDGNRVFISSGYNRGASLLRIDGTEVTPVWESKVLRNQLNASVLINGFLYGIDGDSGNKSTTLKCVEFATGKERWSEPSTGSGALIAADGKLVILGAKGELIVAAADPGAFKPITRAQILGGKCWTTPVLAHGRVYARNAQGQVVCVDVRGAGQAP